MNLAWNLNLIQNRQLKGKWDFLKSPILELILSSPQSFCLVCGLDFHHHYHYLFLFLFRSLKTHWSFTIRSTFAAAASCICRPWNFLCRPPHIVCTAAVTVWTLRTRFKSGNRFWSTSVYFSGSTTPKLTMGMTLRLLSSCRYDLWMVPVMTRASQRGCRLRGCTDMKFDPFEYRFVWKTLHRISQSRQLLLTWVSRRDVPLVFKFYTMLWRFAGTSDVTS